MADEFTHGKLKWLDRAMHDARLKPTEKLVAWKIQFHVNRATMDAWPAQETMAFDLNIDERTVRRAVPRLESLGYIRVRLEGRKHRYAPIFEAEDELPLQTPDNFARNTGQKCSQTPDINAPLTPLSNPSRTPSIRGRESKSEIRASEQATETVHYAVVEVAPPSSHRALSNPGPGDLKLRTFSVVVGGSEREQAEAFASRDTLDQFRTGRARSSNARAR